MTAMFSVGHLVLSEGEAACSPCRFPGLLGRSLWKGLRYQLALTKEGSFNVILTSVVEAEN